MNFVHAPSATTYRQFIPVNGIRSTIQSPAGAVWNQGIYSQGEFLIPGSQGYMARSYDGFNWTYEQCFPVTAWGSARYNIAKFDEAGTLLATPASIAVYRTLNSALSIDNGHTWTVTGLLPTYGTVGSNNAWGICGGRSDGAGMVDPVEGGHTGAYTTDYGYTWTPSATHSVTGANRRGGVMYGNGRWVVITALTSRISFDGITWTEYPLPRQAPTYYNAIFTGEVFVYMAYSLYGYYSTDGINWTQFDAPVNGGWFHLAHTNGVLWTTWEATNAAASSTVYSTSDYVNWRTVTLTGVVAGPGFWQCQIGGAGKFLAVGNAQYAGLVW